MNKRSIFLSESEYKKIVVDWNKTEANYPQDKTIAALFEEQVERTPDNVAIIHENQSMTYAELNHKANQLAHYFRTQNIEVEDRVVVLFERKLDLFTVMLAIFKLGAIYVPVDPKLPEERKKYIIQDTQAKLVMDNSIKIEELLREQDHAENIYSSVKATDIAYIIYTSGTTGQPKGVMIPHQGPVNLITWYQKQFQLSEKDKTIQFASPFFDAFFCETLPYLASGASIEIVPENIKYDPEQLLDFIVKEEITLCDLPTVLAKTLLSMPWPPHLALRVLKIGGEKMTGHIPSTLPFAVWNTYGPTEASVESTALQIIPGYESNPPIGKPIANVQTYILDQHMQPVPIGVTGELHIGGAGLARGYLNQPELSAQKFVPNPFSPDKEDRLYKTGDLCRYLADGNIEYIDRTDHQVKIRGFRIELGEIESCLLEHADIKEAVVLAMEEVPGNKILVAYLVAQAGVIIQLEAIQTYLKSKLPLYMIPSAWVILEKLPLTPNGKLDPKALLLLKSKKAIDSKKHKEPSNETEEKLRNIWSSILKIKTEKISIEDNFFDLGGHSLLAANMMSKINKSFDKNIPLLVLFQYPTIAECAAYLLQEVTETWSPLVFLNSAGTQSPLFCIPPIEGDVACYFDLANSLKLNKPIYGLQAAHFSPNPKRYDSIEELAAYYVAAMRENQEKGTYYLLGWSFGGLVAIEMAEQLRDQGEKAMVILIDTRTPALMDSEKGIKMIYAYHPKTIGFPLTLIRAEKTFDPLREDETLGWSLYVKQPINIHSIDADHFSILKGKALEQLATHVTQVLSNA